MVFLKVSDGYETRQLQLTGSLTFDQLQQRLTGLFPSLRDSTDLSLQYRDSDGDLITLSSDEELQTVLAQLPADAVWKVHIRHTHPSDSEVSLFGRLFEPVWRPFGLFSWPGHHSLLREVEELLRESNRWHQNIVKHNSKSQQDRKQSEEVPETEKSEPQHVETKPEAVSKPETAQIEKEGTPGEEVKPKKTKQVVEHKPWWHYRAFGSLEPKVYESPFGYRTVVGPVGYQLWWGCPGQEQEESTPEQNTSGPQQAAAAAEVSAH